MKPFVLSAIALVALASAGPAAAQMYGGGNYANSTREFNSPRAMTPEQKREAEKNKKLASLQKEAKALQKKDGGTLTAEHRAYIEAKLAEITGAATTQTAAAAPATQITPPQQ